MRISRELEISFALAVSEARRRQHEFLCIEHLLYALLHDDDVAEVIRQCGGDVDGAEARARAVPRRASSSSCPTASTARRSRRSASSASSSAPRRTCSRPARTRSSAATCWSRSSASPTRHAAYLLEQQGITRLDVVSYISHGVSKIAEEPAAAADGERRTRTATRTRAAGRRRIRWRCSPSTSSRAPPRARSIR